MALAESLRLIAEHAPKLRAAGVQSLTVDGVSMVLLPPDPPAYVAPALTDEDEQPVSLLDDPSAYGLPDGAEVPGFRRPDDLPRRD